MNTIYLDNHHSIQCPSFYAVWDPSLPGLARLILAARGILTNYGNCLTKMWKEATEGKILSKKILLPIRCTLWSSFTTNLSCKSANFASVCEHWTCMFKLSLV